MASNKLDGVPGLFSFSSKNPSKVFKVDSEVFLEHFNSLSPIVFKVIDITEDSMSIESDSQKNLLFNEKDHVVFSDLPSKEYIASAIITKVDSTAPVSLTLGNFFILKLKTVQKTGIRDVSLSCKIKPYGQSESKDGLITRISPHAVKIMCEEDLSTSLPVDITSKCGDKSQIQFRAKIAKKNKVDSKFVIYVDVYEITEGNKRVLTKYIFNE